MTLKEARTDPDIWAFVGRFPLVFQREMALGDLVDDARQYGIGVVEMARVRLRESEDDARAGEYASEE